MRQLKVRNANGEMAPLGTLVTVREIGGPMAIDRLAMRPMVEVSANPASGVAVAEARRLCEASLDQIRRELKLPDVYLLTWLDGTPTR